MVFLMCQIYLTGGVYERKNEAGEVGKKYITN